MPHAADEKLGDRLIARWVSGEHLRFADDEARERYQARARLIVDTIRLKDTGSIPVIPCATQKFAFDYVPVTFREAMTEFDKAFDAYVRQYEDTDFDAYTGPEFIFPAGMFEALAWNRVRLPGVHLPDDKSFQFVEAVYMKAEEYDEYLDDPSDWILRKYLPRLSPKLEPLALLPPLRNMVAFFQGLPDLVLAAAENPGVIDAMRALRASGEAVQEWYEYLERIDQDLGGRLALPHLLGPMAHAPFDIISNYYRGWRGTIVDMYSRPEKMIALMERMLPWQLQYGIDGAKALGHPIVTIYLYKGADGLMSEEQYEEFYWPTLKKLILGLVEEGLLVWVFTQGKYDSRLRHFKEIPAGTCLIHLESGTDAFLAKEVLAGSQCIEGNVSSALLAAASVDEVEAYCVRLTEVCGKGGGFMMDFSAFLDEAKRENVKKMIEVARRFGEGIVMIEGVLFDKDGTLLEFHSTQHSIYATLLACLRDDHQVPDPLMQQLSEVLGHLPDRLAPDSLIQFSTNQQIAQALFDTCQSYADEQGWQPRFATDDLLALIEQFSLGDDVPYVALPNVPETLSYLRKKAYRLGVATVDTRTATVAGLKKTGILEYFDYLGTGDDSRPKPDTSLADRFCSECRVLPNELLIVGDGENDMLFAQNVGAHFIGIDAAGEGGSSVFREAGQRSVADMREIIGAFDL